MPKDFARKNKRTSRGASRKKSNIKPLPLKAMLMLAILIGGFAGSLYWLKSTNTAQKSQPTAKPTATPPKQTTSKSAPATKDSEEQVPLYEAHNEMVNKEVVIPAEDLKLPDNAGKYYYTMRCGAFREQQRAEELKAKIAFSGFESNILAVKSGSSTWHRVELGPFTSKRKAESIRHRLQSNDIIDCLINRKIKQ